ncbi:MAG: ferredoxin [Candidatus Micrarchaeota archaeon]
MPYKIKFDKPNCIGCGACAAVAPEFWEMQGDKSHVKDSKENPDGSEERGISDSQKPKNVEAAKSCPVNVIHLVDATGKKLV